MVASLGLRPIHLQPLPYGFQGHLPRLGRGAPWGSRREACKPRSHPHPSRPSVVPPYPFCPFGTFPPDSGNRPSPLKGEGLWAGEDTRPYGGYRSRPFLTLGPDTGRPADVRGASRRPRPAVQHQSHLLGILRRRCGTATAAIFPIPGPSGPAGI